MTATLHFMPNFIINNFPTNLSYQSESIQSDPATSQAAHSPRVKKAEARM
jgi:hypothetical protein